jgi:hypothetical protein
VEQSRPGAGLLGVRKDRNKLLIEDRGSADSADAAAARKAAKPKGVVKTGAASKKTAAKKMPFSKQCCSSFFQLKHNENVPDSKRAIAKRSVRHCCNSAREHVPETTSPALKILDTSAVHRLDNRRTIVQLPAVDTKQRRQCGLIGWKVDGNLWRQAVRSMNEGESVLPLRRAAVRAQPNTQ